MRLRTKFLALLVVIPSISLLLFLYFAYSTFVADKTFYLFERQFQQLNTANLFLNSATSADIQDKIHDLLGQEGYENLIAFDQQGLIVASVNSKLIGQPLKTVLGLSTFEKLSGQSASEGSLETVDAAGKPILVSFLRLKVADLNYSLVLFTAREGATRASTLFLLKSIGAFAILFSSALLISLLFSNRLTNGIKQLAFAMAAFGKGDFDAPLPKISDDEVGQMNQQFGIMRTQIRTLITDREEKTRLETEMQLAGKLQSRFFPQANAEFSNTELSGFFEPAHDAGGDWWFYFQKGRKLVFLIADATGHGINSAMLTAVSRSAFSLIEDRFISASESLRVLNRAIFDSAKNEINMTCAVLCLDLDSGELTYSIAAHEAPYIIPATSDGLKPKDVPVLDCPAAKRLGEAANTEYKEMKYQLSEGDTVFLYSDGLIDLNNPERVVFSERSLLRSLVANNSVSQKASDILGRARDGAFKHRQGAKLVDDLSFMAVTWRK